MSGPMMGDLRVEDWTVRSRLPRESDPRLRGLHPVQSDDARSTITSVQGGAWVRWSWEYPPLFPELFQAVGGWEAELFKVGWGGRVDLLVVDVPVIISDKFQQSMSYMFSKEPQIQFIHRVLDFLVVRRLRCTHDKVDDTRCCTTAGAWG